MTLHQLEIFDAVADQTSITAAARKIKISQPSVSKQLRLLERECGLKLYIKSGRGIKITEEGHLLKLAAKPILKQMEDLRDSLVLRVADAKATMLKIGGTPSPGAFFLPGIIKELVELHPKIHPILRTGYPETIEKMVLNGEVDIAVTTILPDHPQLVAEAINSEGIVAVVSAKHPLANQRRLSEADLMKAPFVMTTGGRIAEEIKKIGLRLNVVVWCESVDLKKAAVQAGLGIGLFYHGSAEAGLKQGYFKPIEMLWLKDINIARFVIYRKSTGLSPNMLSFLSILRHHSKDSFIRPGRSAVQC